MTCVRCAGQPISLSFIGGSITEGGGVPYHDRPQLSFSSKVSNWFIATFPNSSITVQNAGVGGVTSTYYGQCVDMFVTDENVDLVFVDFTLNDRASGVMGKSPEPDTPDRSVHDTTSLCLSPVLAFIHVVSQHSCLFGFDKTGAAYCLQTHRKQVLIAANNVSASACWLLLFGLVLCLVCTSLLPDVKLTAVMQPGIRDTNT